MRLNKVSTYLAQIATYLGRTVLRSNIITIEGVKVNTSLPCFNNELKKLLYLNAWEKEELQIISDNIDDKRVHYF